MTPIPVLLAIAIIVLFAIMVVPTVMALRAVDRTFFVRMVTAVVIFAGVWVISSLYPFPKGAYQDGLGILAPFISYLVAQHYMNSVYEKETAAGGALLTGKQKLAQLTQLSIGVLACTAVAIAAAYLPAQAYLLLWKKIDGTAAGVVGILFWIFGVHVVWIAEAGLVGIIWRAWSAISKTISCVPRPQRQAL